eukprot:gene10865-3483_t
MNNRTQTTALNNFVKSKQNFSESEIDRFRSDTLKKRKRFLKLLIFFSYLLDIDYFPYFVPHYGSYDTKTNFVYDNAVNDKKLSQTEQLTFLLTGIFFILYICSTILYALFPSKVLHVLDRIVPFGFYISLASLLQSFDKDIKGKYRKRELEKFYKSSLVIVDTNSNLRDDEIESRALNSIHCQGGIFNTVSSNCEIYVDALLDINGCSFEISDIETGSEMTTKQKLSNLNVSNWRLCVIGNIFMFFSIIYWVLSIVVKDVYYGKQKKLVAGKMFKYAVAPYLPILIFFGKHIKWRKTKILLILALSFLICQGNFYKLLIE